MSTGKKIAIGLGALPSQAGTSPWCAAALRRFRRASFRRWNSVRGSKPGERAWSSTAIWKTKNDRVRA